MAATLRLALPAADLTALRDRVRRLGEPRPAVYRMLDPHGRVIYVGKAKRLRQRLLSYFRASYPEDKAARILHATADLAWDYVPSEFAAHLTELRQIARWRPPFNWHMNRARRTLFVKVSGGAAPRLGVGGATGREDHRWYGPFTGVARVRDAVRALNDLLGPEAESLALRLERATDEDQLRAGLERAVQYIANARGGGAAASFATRFLKPAA